MLILFTFPTTNLGKVLFLFFFLPECTAGRFQCDNGHCLRPSVVCDGVDNCDIEGDGSDLSDERHCFDCDLDTEYMCTNGQCMDRVTWCDGVVHCLDGSDEEEGCGECFD